jgi:hypothetical protein
VISVGVFFTLMVLGLSSTLPHALSWGLRSNGVAAATANHAAGLPPISVLFAAFLGYNPIQHVLGSHALNALGAHSRVLITGRSFFPHLISTPFRTGLHEAFAFAIAACLVAAGASLARGGRYYADQSPELPAEPALRGPSGPGTGGGAQRRRAGGGRCPPTGTGFRRILSAAWRRSQLKPSSGRGPRLAGVGPDELRSHRPSVRAGSTRPDPPPGERPGRHHAMVAMLRGDAPRQVPDDRHNYTNCKHDVENQSDDHVGSVSSLFRLTADNHLPRLEDGHVTGL